MAYKQSFIVAIVLSFLVSSAVSLATGLDTRADRETALERRSVTMRGVPENVIGPIGDPLEAGVYDLQTANFFYNTSWVIAYSEKYERPVWLAADSVVLDDEEDGLETRQGPSNNYSDYALGIFQCPPRTTTRVWRDNCSRMPNYHVEHIYELQTVRSGFLDWFAADNCSGTRMARLFLQRDNPTCWTIDDIFPKSFTFRNN
jgi:hypothetical protein